MLIASDHAANRVPGMLVVLPNLSFVDPPQVEQPAPESYEHWRQWRYEHVSLETHLWAMDMGWHAWMERRPWWVSL